MSERDYSRSRFLPRPTCSRRGAAALCLALALATGAPLKASESELGSDGNLVHVMDFTDKEPGKAISWLRSEGYELRLNAKALNPRFTEKGLVLSTDKEVAGMFERELKAPDADRIRVTWGVDRYPEGADWENGVYRVPIAVMVSFGDKNIGSGSLFVPNAPYFISLFLSKNAKPGKAYTANYYQKGGRYFCQPCNPPPGETVTTELDLDEAFQEVFDKSEVPPISRFSIQMNTNDTEGGASAHIQRVELLDR